MTARVLKSMQSTRVRGIPVAFGLQINMHINYGSGPCHVSSRMHGNLRKRGLDAANLKETCRRHRNSTALCSLANNYR